MTMELVAHLWEIALAVAYQQASLAAAAIADDHDLLGICRGLRGVCGRGLATAGCAVCDADGASAGPCVVVSMGRLLVAAAAGLGVVGVAVLVRRHGPGARRTLRACLREGVNLLQRMRTTRDAPSLCCWWYGCEWCIGGDSVVAAANNDSQRVVRFGSGDIV